MSDNIRKIKIGRKPKAIYSKGKYKYYVSSISTWLADKQVLVEVKLRNGRDTRLVLSPPAGPCEVIYTAGGAYGNHGYKDC